MAGEPIPLVAVMVTSYVPAVPAASAAGVPEIVAVPAVPGVNCTLFGRAPLSLSDAVGNPLDVTLNETALPTVALW